MNHLTHYRWINSDGFTLIELLMAMALFSIIGTVLFIQLQNVLTAKDRMEIHATQLAQMQSAMQRFQQDIEQIIPRSIRNETGDVQSGLIGKNSDQMEWVHLGWTISPFTKNSRSELQRVRYQLEGHSWVRFSWPHVDRSDSVAPQRLVLLDQVNSWQIHYGYRTTPQGELQFSETWPPLISAKQSSDALLWPVVIRCEWSTAAWGKINRLFILPKIVIWEAHGS